MSTRKPGRPPIDPSDPSVAVSLALPSREYDAIYRRASAERLTVPELIRRAVRLAGNKKTKTSGA